MRMINGSVKNSKPLEVAVSLFVKEMTENGWMRYSQIDSYNSHSLQKYFAIEHNGKIVSFLVYAVRGNTNCLLIKGAWTHPRYRRRKLYNTLFQKMADVYRDLGYDAIISGFHTKNTVSRKMQENQGREIDPVRCNDHHRTVFYLKKDIKIED